MNWKNLTAKVALCLGVCTHPIVALAGEPDPVNADPKFLAALIQLPNGVALKPDGALMLMSATRSDTGGTVSETYALVKGSRDNEFVLSSADQRRFKEQQRVIREWKATLEGVEGSFSLSLNPCLTDPNVRTSARVSIAIRDTGPDFREVVDEMRLSKVLGQPIRKVELCSS